MGQDYDTTKYKLLGPADFHLLYLKTDSSVMVDVREPFEFKGNHIREAVNIPSSGNFEREADSISKDFTYFLYCSTDYRSRRVAEKLYDKGFRKLVILKGGITGWKKEGLPVKKGKAKRKRITRSA